MGSGVARGIRSGAPVPGLGRRSRWNAWLDLQGCWLCAARDRDHRLVRRLRALRLLDLSPRAGYRMTTTGPFRVELTLRDGYALNVAFPDGDVPPMVVDELP